MARKIYGTNNNDTLEGGAGADIINAKAGDDIVSTGASADKVFGKTGEDTITLGSGSDKAYSGQDDDFVDGGNGSDIIYGGQGNDVLYGGDVIQSEGADNSAGGIDDKIWGGSGNDEIYGQSGNDRLFGQNGEDVISGQAGADEAYGGKNSDVLSGGLGNDILDGGEDADILSGNEGSDTLKGAHGTDILSGGSGNDLLEGGSEDDTVNGDAGTDAVFGDAGMDLLYGGSGNDEIHGGDDNDTGYGNEGNDRMFGGSGADVLKGGTGEDFIQGDSGNDVIHGEEGDDVINAGVGNDTVYGGEADDEINLYDGNDIAVGGAGEDNIDGGNGDDLIYGDKLAVNILSESAEHVGQSIAQFSGSDWTVVENAETGQSEMSQSVNTDVKTTYTISIDVAANFAAGLTSGAVEVLWNGNVIDKIEVQTGVFETKNYDVLGAGNGTGLMIRTAEPENEASSIYDTSGPIFSYEKTIDLGNGAITVDAFAPGQAKLFQVISGQLQVFDTATQTYIGAGPETGVKVNAIGLNVEDDLIYGYAKASGKDALGQTIADNSLVMMDAKGQIYKLGDGDYPDFVGDFDGKGNLWTFHTTLDRVTKIDVDNLDANGNPVVETFYFPTDLSKNNMYDVAFNPQNGMFYGVVAPNIPGGQGKIIMIDLTEVENGDQPVIAEIPITHSQVNETLYEGMAKGAYGAVFMDGLSNLYTGLNNGDHDLSANTPDNGGVYRIVFDEAGREATAELMAASQSTGNNDGAMDTRGNDPFADVDATANVLVKNIKVVQTEGEGWNDIIFGGLGDDVVYGGGRDDNINGGLGDDTLYGEAGLDFIYGLEGNDELFGGSGNDSLFGGLDNDNIDGGLGNDTIFGDEGDDILHGDAGNDLINGGDGSDAIFGGDGRDALSGGLSDDTLEGGSGNDILNGNEGADWLSGGSGKDELFGNTGEDYLLGGAGNDVLNGGAGNDTLNGGSGNDNLLGGSGADTLTGDSGNDHIHGNEGNDQINGGAGIDVIIGGSGLDIISGGTGGDRIFGGSDGDTIFGDAGNDQLNGEAGSDIIRGGNGADTISGGDGDDWIEAGNGRNILSGGDGSDTFVFLSDNGFHHDIITDYQCYGENADTIDLASFQFLDNYETIEDWQSDCITFGEDNTIQIKLGYWQSIIIEDSFEAGSSFMPTFIDTLDF
ncbi:calcium-binding protein [Lentilitoribacter sp. EG35]|uniref:calcium-binding protein n=1 Tax=Lentilitoribacter sp. EG35 TaxID=3234192 RepID=UPI003461429D